MPDVDLNKELQEWAILLLFCSLRSFLLLRSFVSSQKKNGKMQRELDESCVRETWREQEATTQWGSRLLTRPFFCFYTGCRRGMRHAVECMSLTILSMIH
jgi:hypothetical protein